MFGSKHELVKQWVALQSALDFRLRVYFTKDLIPWPPAKAPSRKCLDNILMIPLRNYLTSIVLLVTAAPALAESWVVESQADWTAARGAAENVELADGFAEPKADKASFQSVVKTFPTNRKLSSVVFEQSPVWDNWEKIDDITPPGAGNAYVFLPVAPGDYYFFATKDMAPNGIPRGSHPPTAH